MTTKQHIYIAKHHQSGPAVTRLIRAERASHVEAKLREELIEVRRATPDDVATLLSNGVKLEGTDAPHNDSQIPLPVDPPAKSQAAA